MAGGSLSKQEIGRYGRQLILPEWGPEAQLAVRSSSVLVVGVGGLGCPAALYLSAAGIGHIGLLDYDAVELSNLHRQILHSEKTVGLTKPDSAKKTLNNLNSDVECTTHNVLLTSSNALTILKEYPHTHPLLYTSVSFPALRGYDVIVDATDNVATRYLLNDGCVLLNKPLVSGSALRFEGQLTVYHHNGGPCYRCIFPSPPPPNTVTNCSEGGVLGVVPGIIGNLQALEVLKIAAKIGTSYSQRLLLFDALEGSFRTIKLRPRQLQCAVCGDSPSITELQDYELFCGSRADDKERSLALLPPEDRISCSSYKTVMDEGVPHVLLDVREPVEYEICHLDRSINLPLRVLQSGSGLQLAWQHIQKASLDKMDVSIYVVCRRGNDSQEAVKLLKEGFTVSISETTPPGGRGTGGGGQVTTEDSGGGECLCDGDEKTVITSPPTQIRDLVGGLTEWAKTVDPDFPIY